MDIYREEIVDHYKNPRNFNKGKKTDARVAEKNVSCGDMIGVSLKIKGEKVEKVEFQGEGCAISIASASMLTEMVLGKKIKEVKQITEEKMIERLGIKISLGRRRCATLGLMSLKKALKKYEEK